MRHRHRAIPLVFASLFVVFSAALPAQSEEPDVPSVFTLDTLKEALRTNNPDIRTARQDYQRALLDVKDAKASRGPSVDFQFSGTYMANPVVDPIKLNIDDVVGAIQWPAGATTPTTGQYITIFDGMEKTMYQLQMTLTQPIFTWGKLSQAQKLYESVAGIRETNIANTTRKLEVELETRLASLNYLYQIESILAEEKRYAERLVRYSEDGEQNGMILHQDVVDARIQAKQLDIAIQSLDEQIENQFLELRRQTGIQELSRDTLNYAGFADDVVSRVLSADREDWLNKALSPDAESIRMVSQLKAVSDLATDIAENSVYWKPDFAVQVAAGYSGSRFPLLEPNWLRKDDWSLNLSIGLKMTVWDGGKKLNDIARRLSESESAAINLDATEATIRQTLATQWNTADMCTIKIDYQDLRIEAAEAKIAQQEKLFMAGYGSETDLLSAKIDWCNQRLEKEQQALSRVAACYTILFLCE